MEKEMLHGIIIGLILGLLVGFIVGYIAFPTAKQIGDEPTNVPDYSDNSQNQDTTNNTPEEVTPPEEKITQSPHDVVTITDLAKHPQDYQYRTLEITGTLKKRIGGYSLEENYTDWIWIGEFTYGDDCIDEEADYKIGNAQYQYTATGIWTAPEECSYGCSQPKYDWHLVCSKLVELRNS